MKRREIENILKKAGFELEEGGNHTKILKDGRYISSLGRHKEIPEKTVKAIEKQTGIKLLK